MIIDWSGEIMFWFLRPGLSLNYIIMRILSVVFIVFLILPLHEFAHGYIANKLGDKTAKYSGRLTLNPIYHLDPLGALALLLFGFGWAKPVPIDPRNFKNPKSGMAITAAAGPISNFLAALVGGFLYYGIIVIFYRSMSSVVFGLVQSFFMSYISINIGLAVFNLLPIPPLDGSKILGAFLPDRILYKYYEYQNIINIVMFALLFVGVLSIPLMFLQEWAYVGVMKLARLPFEGALKGILGV